MNDFLNDLRVKVDVIPEFQKVSPISHPFRAEGKPNESSQHHRKFAGSQRHHSGLNVPPVDKRVFGLGWWRLQTDNVVEQLRVRHSIEAHRPTAVSTAASTLSSASTRKCPATANSRFVAPGSSQPSGMCVSRSP